MALALLGIALSAWPPARPVMGAAPLPLISEFLAVNSHGWTDEDGDPSDWIELHNPGVTALNLDGWFLTDEATNLTKWRFPAWDLPAGGYVVVFASDKNRTNLAANLHTNFKLSGDGEYLALVAPDGVTVASEFAPTFPAQIADVSHGLTRSPGTPAVLVASQTTARLLVPTGPLPANWTGPEFEPGNEWIPGALPAGYELGAASASARVLLVVNTSAGDSGQLGNTSVSNRLAALGHQVTMVDDEASSTSDAEGQDLIVISSTVLSGSVGTKFRDVTSPVINWERSLLDEFRLGASGGGGNFSEVLIAPAGAGHPLAAGLGVGLHAVRTNATDFQLTSANGLAPGALVIATTAGGTPALVVVEAGALLLAQQAAPARRIQMFWGDAGLDGVTETGRQLFDAAVHYALSGSPSLVFKPLLQTDLESRMHHRNSTALARMTFTPPEGPALASLTLSVRYDDGFAAHLNGVSVASHHAPHPLSWNSSATTQRLGDQVLAPAVFDLSPHLGLLTTNDNVLAIHGLNLNADDGDFLLEAGLTGAAAGVTRPEYYATPTPGAANVSGGLGVVPELVFSHDRGYYTNAFLLTVSNGLAGVEIRYTTNGTPPTSSTGIAYVGPIPVNGTRVIRAAGFKPGYLSPATATMTYLFAEEILRQPWSVPGWPEPLLWAGGSTYVYHDYEMDPEVVDLAANSQELPAALRAIPTLSLVVKPSDMWDANGEGGFYRGAAEAPVSVELIYPDDPTHNVQVNAAIEGHSHDRLKRSLRLSFKADLGATRFRSELFKRSPLFGDTAKRSVNSIVLRGGNNRCWARVWNPDRTTYTEDEFYRSTQIAASGVGSHGAFVHLYINGLYWGLYNPVERPDAAFAASYLGGEDEDWFAANHGGVQSGDATRWNYLKGALLDKDLTDPATYAELQDYLAIEPYIDYLLASWFIDLRDWPGNNWWVANRNTPPGPAYFFAWDGEWSFGTRGEGYANVAPEFRPEGSTTTTLSRIWHAARRNRDFMMQVADRTFHHTRPGGALSDPQCRSRWQILSNHVYAPVLAESARWGDSVDPNLLRTREVDWMAEVIQLDTRLDGNAQKLIASMRSHGFYPLIDPPVASPPAGLLPQGVEVSLANPNPAGTIHYRVDGWDPRLPGGGIHPAALRGPGGFPIQQSTRVLARVLDGTNWSAVNEILYAVPGATTLRLTEIHYHPAGPTSFESSLGYTRESDFEFIELKNVGGAAIPLSHVRFTEGIDHDFPDGILGPGQLLLLVRNLGAFQARYGADLPVAGVFGGALDNDGDTLRLRDAADQIIFQFRYEDAWQPSTDGGGHSLVPTDLLWPGGDPALPASWRASTEPHGSPGRDDAAPVGYASWRHTHFTPEQQANGLISDPEANPDHDLWPNFAEYAFGLDPWASGAGVLPVAGREEGRLTLVYRQRLRPVDVAYEVQTAATIAGPWANASDEIAVESLGADGVLETIRLTFERPMTDMDRRFVRVAAFPID